MRYMMLVRSVAPPWASASSVPRSDGQNGSWIREKRKAGYRLALIGSIV